MPFYISTAVTANGIGNLIFKTKWVNPSHIMRMMKRRRLMERLTMLIVRMMRMMKMVNKREGP